MLQPVLHLHFADAGRTVAAPAATAEPAAKCSDAPGTCIPGTLHPNCRSAARALLARSLSLPVPLLDFAC
jgi:hypothetical protein